MTGAAYLCIGGALTGVGNAFAVGVLHAGWVALLAGAVFSVFLAVLAIRRPRA